MNYSDTAKRKVKHHSKIYINQDNGIQNYFYIVVVVLCRIYTREEVWSFHIYKNLALYGKLQN